MSARQMAGTAADRATTARTIPSSSAVLNVVVRVAGDIPARLDLTHAGTREQQLGMSLGTVLIYLRSATTARAVAEGWRTTAMLARPLSPILTGRRPSSPGRPPPGSSSGSRRAPGARGVPARPAQRHHSRAPAHHARPHHVGDPGRERLHLTRASLAPRHRTARGQP